MIRQPLHLFSGGICPDESALWRKDENIFRVKEIQIIFRCFTFLILRKKN